MPDIPTPPAGCKTTCMIATATLVFGLSLAAIGQLADPFSVSAELRDLPDGTVLAVSFAIPSGHYLYADQVTIEALENEVPPMNLRYVEKAQSAGQAFIWGFWRFLAECDGR